MLQSWLDIATHQLIRETVSDDSGIWPDLFTNVTWTRMLSLTLCLNSNTVHVAFEGRRSEHFIWRTLMMFHKHCINLFFSVSLWFSKHVILVRVIYPGWDVSSSQGIMYTKIHTPIHIKGKFRVTNPPTGRLFSFLGEHWRKQRKSTWRLEELCTNISQNIFPSLNLLAHVTRGEFMIL